MGSSKTTTSRVNLGRQASFETYLSGADTTDIDKQIADTEDLLKTQGQGGLIGDVAAAGAFGNLKEKLTSLQSQREEMLKKSPGNIQTQYRQLQDLVNLGPGEQDVTAALGSQRDLAEMLRQYSAEGGNLPSAADISRGTTLSRELFNPQYVALQQSLQDQATEASRRSAIMGRSLNDPILAAKLAQEQIRQQSMLEAQRGAFATQWSLGQPGERLQYAGMRNDIMTGLANQAMMNRQSILNLGSQLQANERSWRLNTAERVQQEQSSPGFGEIMSGVLQGATLGLSAYGALSGGGFKGFGGGAKGASGPVEMPMAQKQISNPYDEMQYNNWLSQQMNPRHGRK